MKMTTGILIVGLLALVTIIGVACKGKSKNETEVKKTKLDENPYQGLREQAISATPEQLQLQLENEEELYGIVMDWNMGDAIATVVSFKTGDASVYLSTGQGFIGGYAHETVVNSAKNFIVIGKRYLSKAKKTEKTEPMSKTGVNFYFLTKAGKFYIEEDFTLIENEKSEFLELFEAGNQVITEYRLISN
ncbi:MAG: hypothetical protein LBQ22_09335 [Bacteroidales bacterium]|jgi:hypothetical protein|nr:hypothetical protein [Bacteroidales bacterium]